MTTKRQTIIIYRLTTTPQLLTTYKKIITKQKTRNFIKKTNNTQPTNNTHYIPHHPIKKNSTTTPIKIIYNYNFHSSFDNPNLNNYLHTNPPFLNNIYSILLRFRTFTYNLSTNIEKTFLHINLNKNNKNFTKFF